MNNLFDKVKATIKNNNSHIIIAFAMIYVSCKLTCNPLFFRQINLTYPFLNLELKVVSSSLVFPLIYILSDLIVIVSNRMTAVFIIIVGIICDGIFSFSISYVATLPLPSMPPSQALNTDAINIVGGQIWKLYVHGVLATIIANIAEVLLFARLFSKIKSFFLSTTLSVLIILVFHNIITDYPMLKNQIDAWNTIFNGLLLNMSILTLYAAIFSIFIWLHKKRGFLL